MLLEGTTAELVVKLAKTYRKYIWNNKNIKPMLYVQLKCSIWSVTCSPEILETPVRYTKRMGFST